MTTQDPGASAPDSEPPRPDLTKRPDPEPPAPDAPESGGDRGTPAEPGTSSQPDLGRTFDYDATAQASLSAQPPTLESLGGATGTPGPGWDTYSGVGNGPGWGNTPSYPPPPEHRSDYPSPSEYPYPHHGAQQYGTPGPVYGTPDPRYPTAPPSSSAPTEPVPRQSAPPPGGMPPAGAYGAYGVPQGYGGGPGYGYVDPSAPYGRDPYTGEAYSEKSKVTSGILGILLGGFGAGRFYLEQPGMAVAQIAVTWLTCGIGGVWPLIDGVLMLTGKVRDKNGRPLRP